MASISRDKGAVSVSGPSLIPAGELAGKSAIALTRPIIVAGSRNVCRLQLISRTVSKSHCLLVVTRHTVFIRDLSSREGTFVNGERVHEQDLAEGDIVKIGRFEFIFATGGAKLRPEREKRPPPSTVRAAGTESPPIPLEGRVTLIGRRGNADIPFLEDTVSTAHAVVVAWEGRRYVRDLGSRSGTFVNGKPVHQQEIFPGDQIKVGDTDLVYEISTPGAGVEVVAAPTESAVAKAIGAQEIESVPLSSQDSRAPSEKPKVAAPETRLVRPAAPEGAAPVHPAAESIRGLPAVADDSLVGAAAVPAEELPRRGWHRAVGDEVPAPVSPEQPAPQSEAPAEAPAPPAAAVPNEVVEPAEPTPASALPLETVVSDAADEIVEATDPTASMTDTTFNRELVAMTESGVGEPIIAEPAPVMPEEIVAELAPVPALDPPAPIAFDLPPVEETRLRTQVQVPTIGPIDLTAPPETGQEVEVQLEPAAPMALQSPAEVVATETAYAIEPLLEPEPTFVPAARVDPIELSASVEPIEAPVVETGATVSLPPEEPLDQSVFDRIEADIAPMAESAEAEHAIQATAEAAAMPAEPLELSSAAEAPPAAAEPAAVEEPSEPLSLAAPAVPPTPDVEVLPIEEFAPPPEDADPIAPADAIEDVAAELLGLETQSPAPLESPLPLPPEEQVAAILPDEPDFRGDLLEVPAQSVGHDTAFAVMLPPLSEAPPALELSAATTEAAAGETAFDLLAPPLSATEDSADGADRQAPPDEIHATLAPPPLPANAPTLSLGEDDQTPSIVVQPRARKPVVIRDGFNKRGTRQPEDLEPEASPFAAAGETIESADLAAPPDDIFATAPADAFSQPPPSTDDLIGSLDLLSEPLAPPSEIAGTPDLALPDEAEATAEAMSEADLDDAIGPADPTQEEEQTAPAPRSRREIRSFDLPLARPVRPADPAFAPVDSTAVEVADLHELRRRRLRWIPAILVSALLLSGIATGAVFWLFPVHSELETALKFKNFEALTIAQRRLLEEEQRQLLRADGIRKAAIRELRTAHPELASGFLDRIETFDPVIRRADWPQSRPGELVLSYRGSDPGDRHRLYAVASVMYGQRQNQDKISTAVRVRKALKDLADAVESNTRKLNDLGQQIQKERLLGESRPSAGEIELLESELLLLEKSWTESIARLKDAQAEEARIDKQLAAARDNPPRPPEDDSELQTLLKQLGDLQVESKALQSGQSEQAASARKELDAAMDAFQQQIEEARGKGAESPELARYISSAEELQKTTRQLLDELLDRQQKQYQQLSELKRKLDDKAIQRATELRAGDEQLRDMVEKRELYRRQVNAAIGAGLDKQTVAEAEDNLKLVESLIRSREELLSSDPLYAETIKDFQQIIDQTQANISADRKKADERLDELQKSFAISSPAVSNLPEEQKQLAEGVKSQLSSISSARKRFADVVEADRVATEEKLKQVQGRVIALQGQIESRKKLLTDEFTTRSVAALSASLEHQRKSVGEAQSAETVARAAFEDKSKQLRTARDTVEALKNSDDRMARLIAEKDETDRVLQVYNDQLRFKQDEANRLVDVEMPAPEAVAEVKERDRKPLYLAGALGSIFLLAIAGSLFTFYSASRLELLQLPPESALPPPTPKPIDPNGDAPEQLPAV